MQRPLGALALLLVILGLPTTATANETLVVPRNEIKSLTQGDVSMMPEGLFQAMTDEEVRDLVAYLKSPRQVPLPASEAKTGR